MPEYRDRLPFDQRPAKIHHRRSCISYFDTVGEDQYPAARYVFGDHDFGVTGSGRLIFAGG